MNMKILRLILRLSIIVVIAAGLYVNLYSAFGVFQTWLLVFYTTISNTLVLLLFIWLFWTDLKAFTSPQKTTSNSACAKNIKKLKVALTWAISITGIVWHLLLLPSLKQSTDISSIEGISVPLLLLSFSLLHTWSPLLAFIDWLLFDKKGELTLTTPIKWLIIPFSYLIFIVLWVTTMGPVNPEFGVIYPYPFIDFQTNGIPKTLMNVGLMSIGMLVLGFIYVALDRLLAMLCHNPASEPSNHVGH